MRTDLSRVIVPLRTASRREERLIEPTINNHPQPPRAHPNAQQTRGPARPWAVALVGLEGRIVEVEADIGCRAATHRTGGLPSTVLLSDDSAPDINDLRQRLSAANLSR